ncbi:hypothetical protein [Rhodococcus sp. (in: high G+C Gram-positive bacteria)]|uniref:hypothetical protein n=1 Tax=Rhodococcus sp. TaxID=1831 RepID=UPI003B8A6DF9
MSNRADPSWEQFFKFFIDELVDLKAEQIAQKFAGGVVSAKQVRDWRRRHSRPLLSQLPELSDSWARGQGGPSDPLFFARMVGAVPDSGVGDEIWLQGRVAELRRELHEVESIVREADTSEATGRIVAAATASREWAVAVQPAVEGPDGVSMHVADLLDFRRVDAAIRLSDSADKRLERQALERTLHAAMSRYSVLYAPTLPSQWSSSADTTSEDPMRLRYSVRHSVAQRSPVQLWEKAGIHSVAVVSLTLGPWTADVAALVARLLGYGFNSTTVLAQAHRPNGAIPTEEEAADYRSRVHRELIARPWHRYVWAHACDRTEPGLFLPKGDSDTCFVWLRESDELLRNLAGDNEGRYLSWVHAQRDISTQVESFNGASINVLPCESRGEGADRRRTPRWDRTFNLAAEIVERLVGEHRVRDVLGANIRELGTDAQPGEINRGVVEWVKIHRPKWL